MEIVVSIADHRSLSRSDMIKRKLYSSIQIGNTCHNGSGVLIQGARFRSGTVENPLILTLKNSQTETVMYVRNIPISTVLERNGLFEQWVAVYPPGDPQNYHHFDAAAQPKEACPQVCISITVKEEDLSPPLCPGSFEPPSRRTPSSPQGVQGLLGTVGLELPVSFPRGAQVGRIGAQQLEDEGPSGGVPVRLDAGATRESTGGVLDGSFQLKAQRLKEQVAEAASAARRAQDVSRSLQESLRIRDDLRQQLRVLHEQIGAQRTATQHVEGEIGRLLAEETQLREHISQRNATFQELRSSRDDIDRELTRVLGEGDRRRHVMEAFYRESAEQKLAVASDIEQSKGQVSEFLVLLRGRQEAVAKSQCEALRTALSHTQKDLARAQAALAKEQATYGKWDIKRQEVQTQLAGLEGAGETDGSRSAQRGQQAAQADIKSELDSKRTKIEAHVSRARRLEHELNENRGQLERMNTRVAELHAEAHEREQALRRCEGVRAELQERLQQQQQQQQQRQQLVHVELESERARTALCGIEELAPADDSGCVKEVVQLEHDLRSTRESLARAEEEAHELRSSCEALQAGVQCSRGQWQSHMSTLDATLSHVAELAKKKRASVGPESPLAEALRELGRGVAARSASMEEVQRRVGQRREELSALREESERAAEAGGCRVARLNGVVNQVRNEVDHLRSAKQLTDMQSSKLQNALHENQASLAALQEHIDGLLSAQEGRQSEVSAATRQSEAVASELQCGLNRLVELEQANCAHETALDVARGRLASKMQRVGELESTFQRARAGLETRSALISREHAEGERLHAQLAKELSEVESACQGTVGAVTAGRQQQEMLLAKVEQASARQGCVRSEHDDRLGRTEVLAREAVAAVQSSAEALEERHGSLAALDGGLESQRSEASHMRVSGVHLEGEVELLEARLERARRSSLEVQRLEQRFVELREQQRQDEERHWKELGGVRERFQKHGAEALQQREVDINKHVEEIVKLEMERRHLLQQTHRLEAERESLEEGLVERGHERLKALAVCQDVMQEGEGLRAGVQEASGLANQHGLREAELEGLYAEAVQCEASLKAHAGMATEQLRSTRVQLEAEVDVAKRKMQGDARDLEGRRESAVTAKQEVQTLQGELEALRSEAASLSREREAAAAKAGERQQKLVHLRAELQHIVAKGEQQESALRPGSSQQRAAGGPEALRRRVLELEESLQRISDSLVEAQEVVRCERAEEEELRVDIQRLQESIRLTNDKTLYQVEHAQLQFETIQKLEEQKRKFEREVELLTLGLHDAEQRNEFLHTENRKMQQQVEGLYNGSLQEWAAEVHRATVAAEVVRYREEIDMWKQKAESARRGKQQELSGLQKRHEEAVRRWRERITSLQAGLGRCEHLERRRAVTLARRQERGEEAPPAGAVPGLVVPQRPLPSGAARRRALLVGVNYTASHAPLKGCVNDVWNLQCLLRYTLQYTEDQLHVLLDYADSRPAKLKRAPTKANILQGLQWLVHGAQPGDHLLFVFCGYGAQHPRSPGSLEHEAYLVPSDFAADLPTDFFSSQSTVPSGGVAPDPPSTPAHGGGGAEATKSYRLLSLVEVHDCICRLPADCRVSVVLDCCYSVVPHVSPAVNFPPTFAKVEWGRVDYTKFRDFISRPRFLELPVLPVQHTPGHLRAGAFPHCCLQCFSGCRREEWCAEFPIEGTVQGAFSWVFLKALAKAHFHCGVYQFQQIMTSMLSDLRVHFKAVEQTPLVQLSQSAGMQDVVLWT